MPVKYLHIKKMKDGKEYVYFIKKPFVGKEGERKDVLLGTVEEFKDMSSKLPLKRPIK